MAHRHGGVQAEIPLSPQHHHQKHHHHHQKHPHEKEGSVVESNTGKMSDATQTWPELVGLPAKEAKRKLETKDPSLNVDIVQSGDLRPTAVDKVNTVRLWLDAGGLVYIVPKVEQPQSTGGGASPVTGGDEAKSWPDLVGLPGEEAKKRLETEDPSLNVDVIPSGELRSTVISKPHSVRLWLDAGGLVYIVPKVEQPPSTGGGASTAASTATGGDEAKTWADLVGLPGEEAKKRLETEDPSLNVDIIPSGELRSTVISKPNTVRLWLDASGLVYIVPKVEQPPSTAGDAGSATSNARDESKSWPELLGLPGEEAKTRLEAEDPSLNVDIIPSGDLRATAIDKPNTVRLWLDAAGLVYIVPKVEQPAS